MIIGIDHILLAAPVGSEEKARAFYGELLGMKELPKPDELKSRGGCWFKCGSQEVHIGIQNEFIPAKKAHPAFMVKNLELLKSRLNEFDYEIHEDTPIERRSRFFTKDPFNNRIEFIEFE